MGKLILRLPRSINQGLDRLTQWPGLDTTLSWGMAPFILFTSLLTHLFGGSAGREGVGLIMGVGASQFVVRGRAALNIYRHHLVYAGIAGGFSALFATPLTAILFVFELYRFRDCSRADLWITTTIASFLGWGAAHGVGWLLPVSHQSVVVDWDWDMNLLRYLVLTILTCAVLGLLYHLFFRLWAVTLEKFIPTPMRPVLGGLIVASYIWFVDGQRFMGLSLPLLQQSFLSSQSLLDALQKLFLTVLTVGSGFKGGEVTPLFVIGAVACNAVASFWGLYNFAFSASLGMVTLFSALFAVPLACAVMACELFGPGVGGWALITCWTTAWVMRGKALH